WSGGGTYRCQVMLSEKCGGTPNALAQRLLISLSAPRYSSWLGSHSKEEVWLRFPKNTFQR
ncbi:hypothetical protein, partial [Sinorhizobium meliloti]|uniref:hypothetical protein n=1 Tax=Rhizobium meliloti TaxID=382 RepID=UPI001AEE73E8